MVFLFGEEIDRFIKSQRKFSDDMERSSPNSMDSSVCSASSLDEIRQVTVDPNKGLILKVGVDDSIVVDIDGKGDAKEALEAKEVEKKKVQAKITAFFFGDRLAAASQTGFVAGSSADSGKNLAANQKPGSSQN